MQQNPVWDQEALQGCMDPASQNPAGTGGFVLPGGSKPGRAGVPLRSQFGIRFRSMESLQPRCPDSAGPDSQSPRCAFGS